MSSQATGGAKRRPARRSSTAISRRAISQRVLPDGYFTLTGRKSDLIISGGFNIYPREIEEFLQEQPEIAEAAVVGCADRMRGEVPVAYIVAEGGFDAGEIESRCREKLASFKVPREFIAVEKLPRNAMGKIQKHLLPKHRHGQ